MKDNSRLTNTVYNFISSVGGQLLTLLMQFIVRTAFINTLGESFLGIGGLFSNILSMLSLVELGVGSAILYKLYDPIAKHDEHKIALLMRFYKSMYRIIGAAVGVVGLCLIPFLPVLIKDYDRCASLGLNAVLIFVLYLSRSVSSYMFFAYKSAIIKANQKEYLITTIGYVFTILAGIVQIICLYSVGSFIVYVIVGVLQVIGQNMVCAILSNRMYPYINKKSDERLDKNEVKDIFKDCGALFLYKMNGVVIKATDNIVLSAFIGLEIVGLYSNYFIFYTAIKTFFNKIYNSVSHSLGNLHTSHNTKHEYDVFETVMLISAIMGATACVGIFVVADEFVETWIGAKWVIKQPFSMLMGLELYTLSIRIALSKYRSTMGLFRQSKLRPVLGMIINVVVSVALVNVCGIYGVIIGTLAADWTTFMWLDPLIVHKFGFKGERPIIVYYTKFILRFLLMCAIGAMDFFICKNVFTGYGWYSVAVHIAICAITVPGIFIVVHLKTHEGKYLYDIILRYVNKFLSKIKKKVKAGK